MPDILRGPIWGEYDKVKQLRRRACLSEGEFWLKTIVNASRFVVLYVMTKVFYLFKNKSACLK